MTKTTIIKISSRLITLFFLFLFFLAPLIMTPINSELFELNKMVFVYLMTTIISASWLIKSVFEGRFKIRKTPLDILILIFLASQIASTIMSIDPHVSLWGYYGRFNGGLIPTISFIILYYIFVTHFSVNKQLTTNNKQQENFQLNRLIYLALISGFLVSIYAIAQHFGIDKHIWVQDVQNRVFSTLGQPNWLAAYIVVLLFIAMTLNLILNLKLQIAKEKSRSNESRPFGFPSRIGMFFSSFEFPVSSFLFFVFCFLFYVVLLFTKSRSGFLSFWIADALFWLLIFLKLTDFRKIVLKSFFILHLAFFILTFIFSSPFAQINNYLSLNNFQQTTNNKQQTEENNNLNPRPQTLDTIITESGDIRKLVWQGAVNAFLTRPVFGWGVETFAWAFYMHKPPEHNLTSEWDFLYNRAHNEYLNYAATSGGFGLGSHLLLIGVFVLWMGKEITKERNKEIKDKSNFAISQFRNFLSLGLFLGWLSILITNFFGFSVVAVSLYFWLIPAMIFAMWGNGRAKYFVISFFRNFHDKPLLRKTAVVSILLFVVCCLLFAALFWTSDYFYARASNLEEADEYQEAYNNIQTAVAFNPSEPLYRDEAAIISAYLSLIAFENEDATASSNLAAQAISQSDLAIRISPYNLNFWKTRTRMFYTLSQIEPFYIKDAIHSLLAAGTIAPNDPKILYNLALLYRFDEQKEEANQSLQKALEVKPDYKDAAYAMAVFAQEDKKEDEAQKWYRYILEKIDPNDEEIKNRVEED